jgi:hypothetical protein
VPTPGQVAVPEQYPVRAHQQPHLTQHATRETVKQRGQERPVARGEPCSLLAELAFQHHELMAQSEDLDVLAVVAHRQQAQHRERVRHGEIRQSQQHGRSCFRSSRHATTLPPTRADEVLGRGTVDTLAQQVQALTLDNERVRADLAQQGTVTAFPGPTIRNPGRVGPV